MYELLGAVLISQWCGDAVQLSIQLGGVWGENEDFRTEIACDGPGAWSVPARAEILCAVAVPSRRVLDALVVKALSSVGTKFPVTKTWFSQI